MFGATVYAAIASNTAVKVKFFLLDVDGVHGTVTNTGFAFDAVSRYFLGPPFFGKVVRFLILFTKGNDFICLL